MNKVFNEIHDELIKKFNEPTKKKILKIATKMLKKKTKTIFVKENNIVKEMKVKQVALGPLLLKGKKVWFYQFLINDKWGVYNVLINCSDFDKETLMPIFSHKEILLRVDSGCLTGQMFNDETCDCKEQLHKAMNEILKNREGIIIHIPAQDGRGKGLNFKLVTLFLQLELGLNTIESASLLAGNQSIDDRTYGGIIAILNFLNINSDFTILLNTNNPDKTKIFKENNYTILTKKSIVKVNKITKEHLQAKKKYLNHNL